jgi:hypothetical protein
MRFRLLKDAKHDDNALCCAQVEMEVTDCLFQQNYGGKD